MGWNFDPQGLVDPTFGLLRTVFWEDPTKDALDPHSFNLDGWMTLTLH